MTPVDKYIRKLLFEFDCVIIPDFGGILTHRIGVQYDESSQIFKPSCKRLAFNEILKIDDGLLVYYLASGENISREKAAQVVRQFVLSLRADLESQLKATIDKIGTFSTNYEGKLIFEPDYSQNYEQDSYGFEEISAERSEWQPNWLRQELNPVEEAEAEVANDSLMIPLSSKNNIRWGWAAAAALVCAASAASYFYKPADNSLLSSLDPISLVRSIYQPNIEKNYESNQLPAESVEISNVKVVYFMENAPEIIQTSVEDESHMDGESATDESVPPKEEQKLSVQPEEDYFLIAGSFSSQKNARKLQSQLVRQGFDRASILADTPGKWVKVSAGSYQTHGEAIRDKVKVDELTRAESWVFHRK